MTYPIYSITPFTVLDYPDKTAAIAWFTGCNMRCLYCYNKAIVLAKGQVSKEEFLRFLDKRIGKLDGIVFSGGECTLSDEFLLLAREVKARGFKLKIDTNASNLPILKSAISQNLIDYIALDFKAVSEKFQKIVGINLYENFIKTLIFLINNNFKFEVRTSIHADLLNENDVSKMAKILEFYGYKGTYYLQNFLDTGENFGNLKMPKNNFNPNKIDSNLKIKLRNF